MISAFFVIPFHSTCPACRRSVQAKHAKSEYIKVVKCLTLNLMKTNSHEPHTNVSQEHLKSDQNSLHARHVSVFCYVCQLTPTLLCSMTNHFL